MTDHHQQWHAVHAEVRRIRGEVSHLRAALSAAAVFGRDSTIRDAVVRAAEMTDEIERDLSALETHTGRKATRRSPW